MTEEAKKPEAPKRYWWDEYSKIVKAELGREWKEGECRILMKEGYHKNVPPLEMAKRLMETDV